MDDTGIHMGMTLAVPKGGWLGKVRSRLIVAFINSLSQGQVVTVATDSSGNPITLTSANNKLILADNGGLIFQVDIGSGGGNGSSVVLQTDGVNNALQTLLNLISGNGIHLTADNSGGVTISATGNAGWAGLYNPSNTYTSGQIVTGSDGSVWAVNIGATALPSDAPGSATWSNLVLPKNTLGMCNGSQQSVQIHSSAAI